MFFLSWDVLPIQVVLCVDASVVLAISINITVLGDSWEEIHMEFNMEQLKSIKIKDNKHLLCKLKKNIYILEQAPCQC